MKRVTFLLLCVLCSFTVLNGKDKTEEMYRYDVEPFDSSARSPSEYIMKVWSYGKIDKLTRNLFKRNAVHAIIFKGVAATDASSTVKGVRPLAPDSYEANQKIYDDFFNSGEYLKYVDFVNDGNILPGDRVKISNKEYKIGMVCVVHKRALIQWLKDNKIVKDLGAGF